MYFLLGDQHLVMKDWVDGYSNEYSACGSSSLMRAATRVVSSRMFEAPSYTCVLNIVKLIPNWLKFKAWRFTIRS